MIVLADPRAAREWTLQTVSTRRLAVVPTMGALHDGHLSLVRRAKEIADQVAVTIFVNPTQFAPTEDLARYPRPLSDDLDALRSEGVSMVFNPTNESIYPKGFSTYVEPPEVAYALEGTIRPGHFRGVCTIVLKLFQIIPAHTAVFGQKDYQQSCMIAAMVRDLNLPIQLDIAPTVREPDGLAMSSRNRYLDPIQRQRAVKISQALRSVEEEWQSGERNVGRLQEIMIETLRVNSPDGIDRLDYAVIVDPESLQPLETIETTAVALIAGHLGATRLIDNMILR
jgi:pantoate--beta-alanine ligase